MTFFLKKQRRTLRQAQAKLCQETTVKYAWIKQHVSEFSVKTMCRFMGVFRSSHYTWLAHHQHYWTRAEAKQKLFEYIEVFYNRERLHSTNNYLSPVDYEMQLKSA